MSIEIAISGIGILLALAGMAVLIFRQVSPIIAGTLATVLVCLMSRLPLFTSLTETYISGVAGFFTSYFFIFLLGNLFGVLYQVSGAASSIGEMLALRLFPRSCMLACLITTAALSYGGINSFVIIFATYPILLKLFEVSDTPTILLPGIACGGMWTFAMTGPFTPQIPNIVSMKSLGTPSWAGLIPGLVTSIAMAVCIVLYMQRQQKRLKRLGLHYQKPTHVRLPDEDTPRPHWAVSLIPLVFIVVVFNVFNIDIVICLAAGILLALVLFWKYLPHKELLTSLNTSTQSAVSVIINTAAIVGFGTVVKATGFYSYAVDLLINSRSNPYLVAAIGANIFAGILGSASGGISLMYASLKDAFLAYAAQGYNLEFIHRLCAFGAGGLDSMPWNGSIVSIFSVCGVTHREAYRYNFVTCAVIPVLCTFLIALPLCILLS